MNAPPSPVWGIIRRMIIERDNTSDSAIRRKAGWVSTIQGDGRRTFGGRAEGRYEPRPRRKTARAQAALAVELAQIATETVAGPLLTDGGTRPSNKRHFQIHGRAAGTRFPEQGKTLLWEHD